MIVLFQHTKLYSFQISSLDILIKCIPIQKDECNTRLKFTWRDTKQTSRDLLVTQSLYAKT